ncbi:lipopolysaccharide biosynthesis protein [Levilactobacillus brevis]|uniref:lipopolysaccharide biosynthesis protein n=1 Tax=Levilactobacillus brevis TaxID=1580 RepID=UPI000B3E9187|nr:polysaccharide biosynthesis C-terminal domain-containing protein [Levilactobacillus brevis]ARW22629.1 hypothetical protein S101174_01812 [Levilactobacillus brevis]
MERYKKLVNNSIIMSIGSFGSKLLTFIMVPLYTFKLSTSEYGITDLIQTLSNVVVPVAFLCIFDAILRFAMIPGKGKEVLSNAVVITAFSILIVLGLGVVGEFLGIKYAYVTTVLIILQALQSVFSQYAKAMNRIQLYAFNGVILTSVTVVLNIILLLGYNMGLNGYLISLIGANTVAVVHLMLRERVWKEFRYSLVSISKIRELLSFSIPLVPNAIAWWMTSTVNRWFVLKFVGTSANGIFAVANKIPSIISVLTSVFSEAWQLSAIEEYGSKDKRVFYSQTFKIYSTCLFIISAGLICVLKPLLRFAVNHDFFTAWQSVPFLILTVIYSSFSGFIGANFTASKNTRAVFSTTIVGMVINVGLNFILTKQLGIVGASISSCISFFSVWVVRMIITEDRDKISLDLKQQLGAHIILFFQIITLFRLGTLSGTLVNFILFIGMVILNWNVILTVLKRL